MTISLRTLGSQLAVLSLSRAFGAACILLSTLLISRLFGAETLAHYGLLLSAASILSVLLPIGFHAIATLFTAEYKSDDKTAELSQFICYAQRLTGLTTLLSAPFALAVFLIGPMGSSYDVSLLALLAVPTASAMAYIYLNSGLLIGIEKHYAAHLPDMLLRPLLVVGSIVAVWLVVPDATTVHILLCVTIAMILAAFYQWYLLKRHTSPLLQKKSLKTVNQAERKKWWGLAPDYMKITLFWDYFFEIHILVAGLIIAPKEVALLYICFRIRQLAGFGVRSIYALTMPKIYSSNAQNQAENTQAGVRTSARMSSLYAIAAWSFVALLAHPILSAFGGSFEDGQSILLIMLATMIIRSLFGPAPAVLGMKRHPKIVVQILVASLVLSLTIMLFGVQFWGATSVAIAYFVSTSFSAIALWWLAKERTGINSAAWA